MVNYGFPHLEVSKKTFLRGIYPRKPIAFPLTTLYCLQLLRNASEKFDA